MPRSPAQLLTLVIGLTLVAIGVLGFFYTASFSTGDGAEREAVLGIFDVNGWHNVMHIVSGAIGLAVVGSYSGARAYAFGLGAVYLVIAVLGFAEAVGSGDEHLAVLHLLIAVAGIGAGLATPAREPRLAA